ncbi:MAG: peptide chain release factor N(5)-glutamine methyltransferase [Thermoanaerobaculia bacterium]
MRNCGEQVALGRRTLAAAGIASPGREAALLLGSLLGLSEVQIRARDDEPVAEPLAARYAALLERRAAGEPMAYLLGRREFYGRNFAVDERVLIPRPETELLVEIALAAALPATASVLDIGTGSGCIALTLAAERPRWKVRATDLSLAALACARTNARRLALADRVDFVAADLAGALALDRFDLVVANPPYIDPWEPALVALDVRTYEPRLALFAPEQGLAVLARLFDLAEGLHPAALLACEIGYGQLDAVLALAGERRRLELVEIRGDLAGIARDVVFRRAS